MNGDVDAYHDPMDMLQEATQFLDRVRHTIIEADSFDDILKIRGVGELYRQYAGQRRYGIGIQNIGAEIKLRAERRAGELLSSMPKNTGHLFRGDTMGPRENHTPTYADLGLDKKQASRLQRAASLPEDDFEQYLFDTKERHELLTSTAVMRLANDRLKDASEEPPIDVRPVVSDHQDLLQLVLSGATYGTLYVDPPYDTMSAHDVAALPIQHLMAEDEAHLHLWTSDAFLFDAKAILEAWGFTYQNTFVWVNPHPGQGLYWSESHALLLLGVRGSSAFREPMRSWVEAPAEPDGGKPHVIRQMIERVSPGPYLELFGEQTQPDWTVWHPQTGCLTDNEQERVDLLPRATPDRLDAEPAASAPPSSSDFQLPPEMS